MTIDLFISDFKLMWPVLVPGAIFANYAPTWDLKICVMVLSVVLCKAFYL